MTQIFYCDTPSLIVLKLKFNISENYDNETNSHFLFAKNAPGAFTLFLIFILLNFVCFVLNLNYFNKLVHSFRSINKKYSTQEGGFLRDGDIQTELNRVNSDIQHLKGHSELIGSTSRLTSIKEQNIEAKLLSKDNRRESKLDIQNKIKQIIESKQNFRKSLLEQDQVKLDTMAALFKKQIEEQKAEK